LEFTLALSVAVVALAVAGFVTAVGAVAFGGVGCAAAAHADVVTVWSEPVAVPTLLAARKR
jgi:hypothetical protein